MIAVFSLTSAMVLFFWVIKRIDLTQASLSIYLLPVFGVLISTVALKEKTAGRLLVGRLLIFVASFLTTTYPERKSSKNIAARPGGPSPRPCQSDGRLEC